MKVNQPIGFEHYQSYINSVKNDSSSKPQGEQRMTTGGEVANTDKVVFSQNAAALAELSRLQTSMVSDVESVSAKRVEALKAQVQDGSYRISSDVLADAILGTQK